MLHSVATLNRALNLPPYSVHLSCPQDKNLHRAVAGGWNLKALAEGKIGTLV